MTILEKTSSIAHTAVQSVFDKEKINYIEAGALYGIVLQGRHNVAVLSTLYNHAKDPELKTLIKESIDNLTETTIKQCEDLLKAGGAELPSTRFPIRALEDHVDIPVSARLSDEENAIYVANIAKGAQLAILNSLHNCYQPEIAQTLKGILDDSMDWNYRLLQLMLNRGWLPHMAKVHH